ncbi:MAG TPA: glucose-6-phosphate dehydrogenase assembly protein OpcA [Candidatus Aquilonibacter sp.]|nr:glucose-6-phosphate dehydrogenase assembly protein OpcA [Candidatus Aquilonibacter sp.]
MNLDVHPLVAELTHARHSAGSMNAATMTLVVFYEDAQVGSWVRSRTRAIADKHPSRVLLFDGTKNEGDQHAEPSATRGEWVEIGVKGSHASEIGAALSMLALAEAPVVLCWIATDLAADERFVTLAKQAHTIVVSSSVIRSDERPLRDLIAFVEAHPEIVVQDIAYLRLAAWQELIAEFFDEPEFLEELTALREVEVHAGSDAEMYYLLGWLASRLDWIPCAPDAMCNSSGDIIHITEQRDGSARRLSKVELRSKDVVFSACVHPDDPDAVCLEVTGAKSRKERCAPLHTMDIASLIERAILRSSVDDIFEQSLALAKLIIERKVS